MNSNNFYTLLDTLHYNSLLSSHVFKIDSQDHLQIIELSPFKNRNEVIPLDLINPDPKISSKPDSQLLVLSIIAAILSASLFALLAYANQAWASPFGLLFLVASIATGLSSYKKSATLYTYRFANANTSLFTLSESFNNQKQVLMFVNALSKRINHLNHEHDTANANPIADKKDDKYSQYTKHLDFLYNNGVVTDNLYRSIHNKINDKVFKTEKKTSQDNIIYFPMKSS